MKRTAHENELLVSAARWEAVLESARDAIICIDATGRITLFNRAAQEMFGYEPAEVHQENVRILMPQHYRDEHDDYIARYQRSGIANAIGQIRHVEAQRKNGEIFPIELSVAEARVGKEVLYTAIVRDVTERLTAERAMEIQLKRQAVVAELGLRGLRGETVSVVVHEAVRHVAEMLEVDLCKVLEYRADGRTLLLRAGVGWKEGLVGTAIVGTGSDSQAGYTLRSGQPVVVKDLNTETRFHGPQLLIDHGVVSGISVVIHGPKRPFGTLGAHTRTRRQFTRNDVHFLQTVANVIGAVIEGARSAEEARLLQELARQRERLADVGAITAKIVHDLGNPLAAVSMQAQLLLRRVTRDQTPSLESLRKPAERILAEARRLDRLASEFMDFARQQRLETAVIHLTPFLKNVIDLWQPVASKRRIRLGLDVSTDRTTFRADEGKIRRVLDNLIKNAVEAIGDGPGEVRLEASLRRDGQRLRITVKDSGPGIPQELQVFKLFETTKLDGSGLGLSIAKQIALAHGGDLLFERLRDRGTAFHLDLPV